ncbi:MAG: hypothetical protein U0Z26_02345 [Anaerolineales bacterium]
MDFSPRFQVWHTSQDFGRRATFLSTTVAIFSATFTVASSGGVEVVFLAVPNRARLAVHQRAFTSGELFDEVFTHPLISGCSADQKVPILRGREDAQIPGNGDMGSSAERTRGCALRRRYPHHPQEVLRNTNL